MTKSVGNHELHSQVNIPFFSSKSLSKMGRAFRSMDSSSATASGIAKVRTFWRKYGGWSDLGK